MSADEAEIDRGDAERSRERPRSGLLDKLEHHRERHQQRPRPVRWLIAAVGLTLFLGGVAMLVLPGPAFAVIPIGLFLLALEFEWAERWLERSVVQAEKAKQAAANTSRTQRALGAIGTTLAVSGVAVWWLAGDIPVVPG